MLQVTDSTPTPKHQTVDSAPVNVKVKYLGVFLSLSAPGVDTGQTVNIDAIVTATAGTPPYTITFTSGASSKCSKDTSWVQVSSGQNPAKNVNKSVIVFPFSVTATSTSQYMTYYCGTVTDRLKVSTSTAAVPFTVNPTLQVSIDPSAPQIDSGQSASMTAKVATGTGTPSYHYQWYTGYSCATGAIDGANLASYLTANLSLTTYPSGHVYYSINVNDSSGGSVCAHAAVTINDALHVTASATLSTIDGGQTETLSALVTGGTAINSHTVKGFLYQWYMGPTCYNTNSSARALTKQSSTLGSYSFLQNSLGNTTITTSYWVEVTDEPIGAPEATACGTVTITINPQLSVYPPSLSPSPAAIDANQNATVTATVKWSGGTSPYSITLGYTDNSGTCLFDNAKIQVLSGSNPKTGEAGNSSSFTFAAPETSTEYCAIVKDKSAPSVESASPTEFTVNGVLAVSNSSVTISPSSNIVAGSTIKLTVTPSQGTRPYSYKWYTGSGCSGALAATSVGPIPGTYSPTIKGGQVTNGQVTYSVNVTDSSIGTPASHKCVPIVVHVKTGLVLTTVNVTCTPAKITVGSGTSCTAHVKEVIGSSTPTGDLSWTNSSSGVFSKPSCILSKGTCKVKFTPTAVNPSVLLFASYNGSQGGVSLYGASVGNFSLTVTRSNTKIRVSCTPLPVAVNSSKATTCTAVVTIGYHSNGTVTWSAAGSGSVVFSDRTCTLVDEKCSVTIIGTASGSVAIEAAYGGDPDNNASAGILRLNIK